MRGATARRASEDVASVAPTADTGTVEIVGATVATAIRQDSELVAEALGEQVFDFFLRNKREEWQEYRRHVTQFELDRYMPVL